MQISVSGILTSDIDMEKCYFNPGCALNLYKPASAQKMLDLLCRHFGRVKMHSVCCHHDPALTAGSVIINNCAGCDRRFRSLYEGIRTVSVWEVLDGIQGLPLPAYPGLSVSVHDSCSFRTKPQVHAAVRSLLGKMQVRIIESPESMNKSVCCGDTFYPRLGAEEVVALQKKRASRMPCQNVAVYCVSCIQSMATGNKTPRHMVDLVLCEPTEPIPLDLCAYHDALNRYIAAH